jgi:hypothetical protein
MNIKKIVLILLIINASIISYGAELGDVNSDSRIDIVDALLVAQWYVGMSINSNWDSSLADVNCDGTINIVDSLLIAQYYVYIIDSFPCGTPEPTYTPDPEVGKVWLYPESITVDEGQPFDTYIRFNQGFYYLGAYEFVIYFDDYKINLDSFICYEGYYCIEDVEVVNWCFVDEVIIEDYNKLIIRGDVRPGGMTDIADVNLDRLVIHWRPHDTGSTILDLEVNYFISAKDEIIGNPRGYDSYVDIIPLPTTPAPTQMPDAGEVFVSPSHLTVAYADYFDTEIYVKRGIQILYNFDIIDIV